MILSLKSLAAAGLVASMATGGTLAVRVQSDSHPLAATAETATTTASAPAADDLRSDDDHETTTSTSPDRSTTTTTMAPLPAPAPAVTAESAGDAGTVDLSITTKGFLAIAAVHPNAGWTVDRQRAEGHEAQVRFSNGARRIEFKAELEHGRLATHIVDHTVGAQPAAPAVAGQPATEADDDHDGNEQEQEQGVEQEQEHSAVAPAPVGGTADVESGSGRDDGDHSGDDGGHHSGDGH
jgi:hypothetical protein